jgi:hypothetical protein
MTLTVVLIGKFFGELNAIKEAANQARPDIRFLSFLDNEDALKLLLKEQGLRADFIVIEETFSPSHLPLLKAAGGNGAEPALILFSRTHSMPVIHDNHLRIHRLEKSQNKRDYLEFFDKVLTDNQSVTAK